MKITPGAYDAVTRTIPVAFEHDGVMHERAVNACHAAGGAYDPDATSTRIAEVARGVRVKIEVGAITNPPPPEEAPAA